MKKFLVTLALLAITIGMVAADPGTGEYATNDLTDADTDRATLEVTLNLSPESNLNKHYQIGFTTTDVSSITEATIGSIAPLTTVALDQATTSGDITHDETIYVYWAIKAPKNDNLKIGLSLPGNMTSQNDKNNGIKWSVTPGAGATSTEAIATKAVSSEASDDDVMTITATGGMDIDSFPITISTVDLRSTTTTEQESYSSMLTVMIASGN